MPQPSTCSRLGLAAVAALSLACASAMPVASAAQAQAQDTADRLTVPFRNASQAGKLIVKTIAGSITVRGTNRKDVLIIARPQTDNRRWNPDATGLRRIPQTGGFKVEEEMNQMVVSGSNPNRRVDFEIEAPTRTHLKLSTVNGGDIDVTGIEGELDVHNTNGGIRLTSVAGSVLANTTNGNVLAKLMGVTPQRPMEFTSLNGSVDVTLPASTKANLKLRSDNGDLYSDFEMQLKPTALPTVRDSDRDRGRYRISANKTIVGEINGGGPEFELRTFNSNVYVRKGR